MATSSFLSLQFPKCPISKPISAFPSRFRLSSDLQSLISTSRLASTFSREQPKGVALSTGYNVQVVVAEDEPDEVLLRRFRREVTKAGVIQECKRRRFFENKQEEKKRKAREAGRRNRRRRSGPRTNFTSTSAKSDGSKTAADDGEDNWEMPVDSLPV